MKEIVFADTTRMEIEEISDTGKQVKKVTEWAEIKAALDRFTRENLNGWHYELNGVRSTEDYFNYRLNDLSITPTENGFTVEFHTGEIPEIDILKERLAAVETSQGDQDDAINYLLMGGE